MEVVAKKESVKQLMWDIIVDISWANLSHKYFGKSRSWLSQKFVGKGGNGTPIDFTDSERETLKDALNDLARRIQDCANKL
jgi:hypothetical protein